MKIKVFNLPYIFSHHEVIRLFADLGTVSYAHKKRLSNIASVMMPYEYQAQKAIESLDGRKILGRVIKVEKCD